MKFNSNFKRECSACKFYKDRDAGHGEPTGYCLLKRYIAELAISFGIDVDSWYETTGIFSECDKNIQFFLEDFSLNKKG